MTVVLARLAGLVRLVRLLLHKLVRLRSAVVEHSSIHDCTSVHTVCHVYRELWRHLSSFPGCQLLTPDGTTGSRPDITSQPPLDNGHAGYREWLTIIPRVKSYRLSSLIISTWLEIEPKVRDFESTE